jgi:hypothetical protein
VRTILISGLAFLLAAALLVRIARSLPATVGKPAVPGGSARAGKSDPLVFVFLRVDAEQKLAILRPMIAPDIGVQLDSGSRQLEKRTVLQCHASMREHDALVDDQISKFSETLLNCGEYKFVLKAIDFSPQR